MMFFSNQRLFCRGLITIIIVGIVIRAILGYTLEYNNDISAMTHTISNIDGGNGLYQVAGYYYPPVWGYMLASFAEVIEHFGIGSLGDYFTEILFMEEIDEEAIVVSPVFSLVYTMYLMISDLLVSALVCWLIYHFTNDMAKAKVGFALFFLGINVILVSAVGGMFDTYSALFTLTCICLLIRGKDFFAGIMFALGVLIKLFPVFLIFILVAYIVKKDRENWEPRLLKAILGAGLITVVIMLPQILEGSFIDSISFITDRASDSSDSDSGIMGFLDSIYYYIVIVLEIVLAVFFVRYRTDDVDRSFMWFVIAAVIIVFLNSGSPQYVILLTPFLILGTMIFTSWMKWPLFILMAGSTVGHSMHLCSDFLAIVLFNHVVPFDAWKAFYDVYASNDFFLYELLFDLGFWIQEIAVFSAALIIIYSFRDEIQVIVQRFKSNRDA